MSLAITHPSKKQKTFASDHKKISNLPIYHLNGSQKTSHRSKVLKEFAEHESAIITNSRCLTEGIDVPAIDAVYFCDPKNSKIDIIQATGRALRRADSKGKKIGYVVVPLFHSSSDDLDSQITASAFATLLNIARSLSWDDGTVYEKLSAIATSQIIDKTLIESKFEILTSDKSTVDESLKESLYIEFIDKFKPAFSFYTFQELKLIVKEKGIKSKIQYRKARGDGTLSRSAPANPDTYYLDEWESWGQFLGTRKIP
jgi:predicted helicase